MRTSTNEYRNGQLINGYDYIVQGWVKDGQYTGCSHPEAMQVWCGCPKGGQTVPAGIRGDK